jgi:hypothetical protein
MDFALAIGRSGSSLPASDITQRGPTRSDFSRCRSPRVIDVDADADDEAVLGWRGATGRFDEDAAAFAAIDVHVVGPFDAERPHPSPSLKGRGKLAGQRVANSHSGSERELRPVCRGDSQRGGLQQNAECERPVGRPPNVPAAAFAGGLMPRDHERRQFNARFSRQVGRAVVRRIERVVNFDLADEGRSADLVGAEKGNGKCHFKARP